MFFHWFSEKIRLDVSSESSARQRIHLKHQALISSKDKNKKLKCRLLQFLFSALRVRSQKFQFMTFTLANDHFIVGPSSVTLTFNLPKQMFQMNNCAILFWNQCKNVEVMARTSSIYDHFIIWHSSITFIFNLPERILKWTTVSDNFEIHA